MTSATLTRDPSIIYQDFLRHRQMMDDSYALAKLQMAEFEIRTQDLPSYTSLHDLIYALEH